MQENKVIGEIFESKDYDSFKFSPQNRFVNTAHVKHLKVKMSEKNVLAPINVTKEGVIQDGQHRFTAWKEMNLPIRYFISPKLTPEEIASMNDTTKRWSVEDYAKTFAAQGNPNYKAYRAFHTRYPKIPHGCSLLLLTNTNKRSDDTEDGFKRGEFVVENESKANKMADKIMLMAPHTKAISKQGFILALLQVMEVKGFDIDRMVRKISRKGDQLNYPTKKVEYLRVMEQIYNWSEPTDRKMRLFNAP